MLADRVPGRMHPSVVDSIVEHSNGNPLAVLALARSLSAQQRAGAAALPDPLPLASGIQDYFLRAVAALPAATQEFVLVAACGSADDPQTVWRAAHALGLTPQDADPAAVADICSVRDEVRFSHPLVRSAIYGSAAPHARRAAHAALAEATAATDPDRRAWHLAQAAGAPDDAVAAELERSAERARARGGHAAQATFLRRSAELTTDPPLALRRTLDAADAYVLSGELETAGVLVERTAAVVDGPAARPRAADRGRDRHRAGAARPRRRDADARRRGGRAGRHRLHPRAACARRCCPPILAGRYLSGTTQRAVAAATLSTAVRRPRLEALDQLFDAFATRIGSGYEAAVRPMRDALDALTARRRPPRTEHRRRGPARDDGVRRAVGRGRAQRAVRPARAAAAPGGRAGRPLAHALVRGRGSGARGAVRRGDRPVRREPGRSARRTACAARSRGSCCTRGRVAPRRRGSWPPSCAASRASGCGRRSPPTAWRSWRSASRTTRARATCSRRSSTTTPRASRPRPCRTWSRPRRGRATTPARGAPWTG